jgi:hypothetical protein
MFGRFPSVAQDVETLPFDNIFNIFYLLGSIGAFLATPPVRDTMFNNLFNLLVLIFAIGVVRIRQVVFQNDRHNCLGYRTLVQL